MSMPLMEKGVFSQNQYFSPSHLHLMSIKTYHWARAGWLIWLERHPDGWTVNQNVAGSIPGQGTDPDCRFESCSRRMWEATD